MKKILIISIAILTSILLIFSVLIIKELYFPEKPEGWCGDGICDASEMANLNSCFSDCSIRNSFLDSR